MTVQLEAGKSISAGDAAHITAASPNGPRYDQTLTAEERSHYSNGIWLCAKDARVIDHDESRYTIEELRRWKEEAEAEALRNLGRPQAVMAAPPSVEQQIIAAVHIQGPNAINISGPNAVVLGPNAIKIVGPVVKAEEKPPA